MKITIDKENENVRLDRFLKKRCKNNKLSEIFKAIRQGDVRVNNKKVKQDYRLNLNDEVSVNNLFYEEMKEKKLNREYANLIFFEDDKYLIINKPKGLAMHKGTGTKKGLAEIFNINFANRLDKKTSGLVIACKNQVSLRHITNLIREHKVKKIYEAICLNNNKYKLNEEFELKTEINGQKAISKYKVIHLTEKNITFRVELITGRKHQIRIQLANLGLAIVGDDKYGTYPKEAKLQLECKRIEFDEYKFEI
ncbi:RluA family pseudouridine synthase [Sneathia sanguinegens]|uniref:RluA family pseudouridine synthase n=1 Tax=Sneathia sanguinegens TaxID=40543 RepID=A0ABT7HKD5_9FUSO|nr:RluA family pseudouridine synthase [Sneathia sanguinegens]MDK9580106.1 RluA family pseudouridine synthase [Sneathia sanguinegens]